MAAAFRAATGPCNAEATMPIEIRELHIKVAVDAKAAGKPLAAAKGGGTGGADKDALIEECVEQVLRIMQAKEER